MKWLLLVTLNICCALSLSAQKVHFTDTTNVWKELWPEFNAPFADILSYGTYSFVRDTTIGSVEYKWFSFANFNCDCWRFVREDTFLKKVYVRAESGDSDMVLMDYNLNVGDTFTTTTDTFAFITNKFVVLRIDSTLINAIWHKMWYFSGGNHAAFYYPDTVCVIEGIGCIQDPTYMLWDLHGCVECETPYMYCFSNKGINPLISPKVEWLDNATSCSTYPAYATLHTNPLLPVQDKIGVFPNPAASLLTITSGTKITTITISNLVGETVFSKSCHNEQVNVDVADLPAGMYLIRINGTEVRKFAKE